MAFHYTFPAKYMAKVSHTEEGFGQGPARKISLYDLLKVEA